jgi:hypothetical protein
MSRREILPMICRRFHPQANQSREQTAEARAEDVPFFTPASPADSTLDAAPAVGSA